MLWWVSLKGDSIEERKKNFRGEKEEIRNRKIKVLIFQLINKYIEKLARCVHNNIQLLIQHYYVGPH